MNKKKKVGKRFSDVNEAMSLLDELDERLDQISDRLNHIWDALVGVHGRENDKGPPSLNNTAQ